MGGDGSGTWYRWQEKKKTVEESLIVSMKDLRKQLFVGASGSFTWSWGHGDKASIRYAIKNHNNALTCVLGYRWRNTEEIEIPVALTTTPTQFNGQRWWFICPLVVAGMECNRRAGKLYLPPTAKYFGCRHCHALTYQSSQEAHQTERLFARLGFDAEVAKEWEHRERTE